MKHLLMTVPVQAVRFECRATDYQILPRSLAADFKPGNDCTVAVKDQPWGTVKSLYRDEE